MSKHAPGPWIVSGKTVKSIHHQRSHSVARVDNKQFTPEANAANARLIAAAPDLLAALREIQANPNDPRAHRTALDVLAKVGT